LKDAEDESVALFWCRQCRDVVEQKPLEYAYRCAKGHVNRGQMKSIVAEMNHFAARARQYRQQHGAL